MLFITERTDIGTCSKIVLVLVIHRFALQVLKKKSFLAVLQNVVLICVYLLEISLFFARYLHIILCFILNILYSVEYKLLCI